MGDGQRSVFSAYLRKLTQAPAAEGSDAQLLEWFTLRHDEAAFTTLLQRHGPLVWSVCRRLLGEEHAAEDAFQATFLVLVRKAASVSKRASLRSWLYGVALRVAVRARRQEQLRRVRESAVPIRDVSAEAIWSDVRPILDEEIQRLPEKYRLPVILCYLEGQTNDEAARVLNCPRGTIATRLARARERLRTRLVHRGLTLSVTAFATMLSEYALSAAMPLTLVSRTATAAPLVAAGQSLAGAVPDSVPILMEGVLHAMSRAKFLTVLVVLGLVIASGSGLGVYWVAAQPPAPEAKQEPPRPFGAKAPEKDLVPDTLKALLQERLKLAREEMKLLQEYVEDGQKEVTVSLFAEAAGRLLKAELEGNPENASRKAAYQRHLKVMQFLARVAQARFEAGIISEADLRLAQYLLVDAKIKPELEKFQEGLSK